MNRSLSLCLLALPLTALSQVREDEEVFTKRPLAPKSSPVGDTLFESIPAEQSKVDLQYELDREHPLRRLYPYGWAVGNCAIGDVDGDGRADLFFPGTTGNHRLFLQREDFVFEDVSALAQIANNESWSSAAVMGDVDNDGDLDIFVARYDAPNQLFMNISRGGVVRFADLASNYGVDLKNGTLGASLVDYSNDGLLDLFLQNYHVEPESGRPSEIPMQVADGRVSLAPGLSRSYVGFLDQNEEPVAVEVPLVDQLLRQTEDRFRFDDQANESIKASYSVAHAWVDLASDGLPDLYTANDSHGPDSLLRNQGGGNFREVSREVFPQIPWFARGVALGDFDRDLLIDLFIGESAPLTHRERLAFGEPLREDVFRVASSGGAMQVRRNVLLQNTGAARFREIGRLGGVAQWGRVWGVAAGDYDGDGWTDLIGATGSAVNWESQPSRALVGASLVGKTRWDLLSESGLVPEPDLAFRGVGSSRFEAVSRQWGLDHRGVSYTISQGDLDSDGDLDLVICGLDEPVRLYRNHSQAERLVIDLEGERSNRFGVGASLRAIVRARNVMQQLFPTGGFKRSDEPAFFIGMGEVETVDRVTVQWPTSGAFQTLDQLESGYRYTFREVISLTPAVTRGQLRPFFTPSNALAGMGVGVSSFDPASVQPLLPQAEANRGPAVAAQDIDRDGSPEVVLGGMAETPSRLISQSAALATAGSALPLDLAAEDAGIVFFDADGDSDVDLFIAAGGIESPAEQQQDRLFLFDAATRAYLPAPSGSLPAASGQASSVAAADFDRDGDVDLFVAGSFLRSQYPDPAGNRLLRNRGDGRFEDATEAVAEGLSDLGPLSSAIWTDATGDGWLDLIMVGPWAPIRLWRNDEGTLRDAIAETGISDLTGLWKGIASGDFDRDGDLDYAVTNEGLGTDYQDGPAELYRGDFLDLGVDVLLETRSEKGSLLPRAGWLDWAELKPDLLEEYSSAADFVDRGIPELFAESRLQSASRWSATELRSGWLRNVGEGRFDFRPFPRLIQAAASHGVVVTEVNFDGNADVILLQNRGGATLRQPDPANGGVSSLLLGTGKADGAFIQIEADTSGLVAFGPGRGLVTLDLNKDKRVDLIATLHGSDPAVYLNQHQSQAFQPLKVDLDTPGKHPAGALVSVAIPEFPDQLAEYQAGGGFVSQSASSLFFGAPRDPAGDARVVIRWADGSETKRRISFREQPQ